MRLLKRLIAFCALLMALLAVHAQEPCPRVIPALQQWEGKSGKLAMPAEGVIVVNPSDEAALMSTARILADDLRDLMGWTYAVKTGKPEKNCVYLALTDSDDELGTEGYVLSVQRRADILAPTAQGVFWGTRTLLQILYGQQGRLPKGTARDYPLYPNRGFMLDVARKFFTLDYLKQYIKVLSFYKMNEFQIHLNDNGFPQFFGNDWNRTYAAFRLESERFPGLTAKDGSYTKQEFTDLQRMGMAYGVTWPLRTISRSWQPRKSMAGTTWTCTRRRPTASSMSCLTNTCPATIPSSWGRTCTSAPMNTTRRRRNGIATSRTAT